VFQMTLSTRLAILQMSTNQWILAQTSFPLPLLIMQGTADQHADPAVNAAFARRLGGDVTFKLWEGLGPRAACRSAEEGSLAYVAHVDGRAREVGGVSAFLPRVPQAPAIRQASRDVVVEKIHVSLQRYAAGKLHDPGQEERG